MSSPEWGSVPLLPLCGDAVEDQVGLGVGKVSVMLQRSLEEFFSRGGDR